MRGPAGFCFFLVWAFPHWLSFRWLWSLTCQTAGLTKQQVWIYRSKLRFASHPSHFISSWIIGRSPHPLKTRLTLFFYRTGIFLNLLCINLSVLDCFVPALNVSLRYASYILPCITAVAAATGSLYYWWEKRRSSPLPNWKKSITESWQFWRKRIFRKEVLPYQRKHPGNTSPQILAGVLKITVVLAAFIGIFFLLIQLYKKMTPATVEQVAAALLSHDLEPQEKTQKYRDMWNAEERLTEALTAHCEDGGYSAAFFVFTGDGSALSLYRRLVTLFCEEETDAVPEIQETANYNIFEFKTSGRFIMLVRVGNTVFYAYGGPDDEGTVRSLIGEIGYAGP